jgi:hypothetical protein
MRERYSAALLATLSIGVSLVAGNARAAYSGAPSRGICPQVAMVTRHGTSGGWSPFSEPNEWTPPSLNNICGITPKGSSAAGYFAIPYDTFSSAESQPFNPALGVVAQADGSSNEVCLAVLVFNSAGALTSSSGTTCSTGNSFTSQELIAGGGSGSQQLTIPADGSIGAYVFAFGAATVDMLVWQQNNSGT